ncbi:MAG TPA: diguanylate cyclase [Acidimicrobiales bacterium]|nr:diguanylate cyclase [Acidimicrobiales bacterium]
MKTGSRSGFRRWFRRRPAGPAQPALPTDPVTGLAGRLAMTEQLAQWIETGREAALVLIDLDGFAAVIEGHGRPAGDRVLSEAAAVLAAAVDGRGSVYRTGDDQFVSLIDAGSDESARRWAVSVQADLPRASAAVVMLGRHRRSDYLFRDAEITMAALKDAGGGMVGLYGPEVDDWVRDGRAEIEQLGREVDELRAQNRRLQEAMLVDLHTGLPNVVAFDADHAQVEARRKRTEDGYSVLFVHVDHLDELLGRVGIDAALVALAKIGATVAVTVRGSDRTYRMGDGEFAVLLPGAELREAVAAAERVRTKVERLELNTDEAGERRLTVVVAAIAASFRHKNAKDVVAELQDVMASGQRAGTNRVIWPH